MSCWDDSLQVYNEALQIRISLFGSRHQTVAKTLHCIGMVHKQIGDLEKAYEAFSEALWASSLKSNVQQVKGLAQRILKLGRRDIAIRAGSTHA